MGVGVGLGAQWGWEGRVVLGFCSVGCVDTAL